MTTAGAQADARFLALGDSYTIGEGVSPAERWPALLAESLRERGIRVADPTIIAKTGWTTDELGAGIDAARPHGQFDLVTLLVGVNNQYRGRSVDEYRQQFRTLLDRAVAFAGSDVARVVVLSIPDWSVTPFAAGRDRRAISEAIDAFNAANREETLHAGAGYVDITPESRRAALDASLIAGDGLHPSAAMYRAWARAVLPCALRSLSRAGVRGCES